MLVIWCKANCGNPQQVPVYMKQIQYVASLEFCVQSLYQVNLKLKLSHTSFPPVPLSGVGNPLGNFQIEN